jgi:hypothetical protein
MMRDDRDDDQCEGDVVAQTEELARFLSSYVDAGGSLDANEAPEEMKPLLQSMQQAFASLSSKAGDAAQVAPSEMLELIHQAAKGALRDPALEASTSERSRVRLPTTRLSEKEITLQPGFVVKSRDANGEKVFINVCGSDEIGVPAAHDDTWREGLMPKEVIRALEAGASSSSSIDSCLRFPLSAADARIDVDSSGQSCVVFDVVFNSTVMRHAMVFKTLKRFLAELCLKVVADKHYSSSNDLSAQYKLPARAFIGRYPPPPHRIRATAPSVVEETEIASAADEPLDVDVEYHGRPVESVRIQLRVPNGVARPREAVCVCVAREAITLDVPNRDSHRVELPFLVDAETARATLRRDNVICITARYKAYRDALC